MNTLQFFTDKDCFPTCDPLNLLHRPMGADLFELQMFIVDIGNSQKAWYGSLQNMESGEKHYFKGWAGLAAHLHGVLTPGAQLEVLKAILPPDDAAYGRLVI